MVLMAGNSEKFARNRLQLLLNKTKNQKILDELALIKPFIDCYSLIFKECLMKKGKLHTITKTCFSNNEVDVYTDFFEKIVKKDPKIQRLWNSNNFIGFISMSEALLVKFEDKLHSGAIENDSVV